MRFNEWCKYTELFGFGWQANAPGGGFFDGEVMVENGGNLLQTEEHEVVVHWQIALAKRFTECFTKVVCGDIIPSGFVIEYLNWCESSLTSFT